VCGITGFCDFGKKLNFETLAAMTDSLHHRGPNDSGNVIYSNHYSVVGLGHKRLSILDLSQHGHQPMSFNNLEIVYNGEVYNFKEIKNSLQKYGYHFKSDSDTEVILKSFDKWGIKAVDKFNGMFAIALYDQVKQKITLIRDRSGVKPCYYYKTKDCFMFSSELKAFHENHLFKKEINKDSLATYLQYGYILQPHTIFKNTYKVKSGHYLELDLKTKNIREQKYWDVIDYYNKPKLKITEHEAIDEIEKLLISSFTYRLVSDVPVGVFLSGGYDSSIVSAILQNQTKQKLNTFTIGFKEKDFNESAHAREVAGFLGTNHSEYQCTAKDAVEIIPKLCNIFDEPFGDSSAIPTVLLSQFTRQKVSVALSADGGDEIFAGYNKYFRCIKYLNMLNKTPVSIRKALDKSLGYINPDIVPVFNSVYNYKTKYEKIRYILKSDNILNLLKLTSQHFTESEICTLIKSETQPLQTNFDNKVSSINQALNQMLAIDYKTYLSDDILTKVDRASMSVSLEGREPFLDHRIIEFVSQLPSNLKNNHGSSKWLLKQVTHKYLPEAMMNRPKMGFGVPIAYWFKNELRDYLMSYLSAQRLDSAGIFNSVEVIRLRDEFLSGKNSNIRRLWFILMFEMWHEKWM
jgi:asparagine synthase (glutamine-hydrolysing)